ncbi:MAG: glycosyltransferase family 39 protein [Myxococcaceae bacterium]|nr:glycosyltransferase family 39 protein [Myxococcaceae bacterium]MCA3013359.1 glycosyltransferase family 39 protein [Myxococcaceae bacterium]
MTRTTWAVLLTLVIAPAGLGLTNEIQEVDPAQYADVARRMVESGDWLHLRDGNGPFYNKPPLTMWLQAAGMLVFGVGELAVRLPGLLFAVLTMVSVFFIGRELGDERRGLAAAALTGGALSMHLMVLDPKVDAALTATTTLAIALMLVGRRRPWLRLAAWAVAGLAVLSKGPLGLGIPVLALLPEVLRASWLPGPSTLARRLWSVWPFGALLTALVAAPFYAAMHQTTGAGGLKYLLWDQGFGRLWGASGYLDDTTPLFFMHTALWAFLPFTPLLLVSLARRLGALVTSRALPGSVPRVALWWLLLVFGVISVSTYKLPQYLYPLTPPAALLAAEELERLDDVLASRWRWCFAGLSLVGVGFVFVVFVWSFPASAGTVAGWGALVALVAAALLTWARRLPPADGLVASAALSLVGVTAFVAGYLQPRLLEFQPSRELGQLVRALEPDTAVLPITFHESPFSAMFYARRDVPYVAPNDVAGVITPGTSRLLLVGPEAGLEQLHELGLGTLELASLPTYPTSRPSGRFLAAATRASAVGPMRLVRVWRADAPPPTASPPAFDAPR